MDKLIKLGSALKMVDDMELIENFIGKKSFQKPAKFVGGMVHISIADLAKAIRKNKKEVNNG